MYNTNYKVSEMKSYNVIDPVTAAGILILGGALGYLMKGSGGKAGGHAKPAHAGKDITDTF